MSFPLTPAGDTKLVNISPSYKEVTICLRKFENREKSTGDHQSWRLFFPLERLEMSHVKLSNSNLDLFSLRRTSKTLAAVFNLFEIFIINFNMGALCSESTLTSWVPPSRALIASFLSRSPLTPIVPTNDQLLSRSLSSQVE